MYFKYFTKEKIRSFLVAKLAKDWFYLKKFFKSYIKAHSACLQSCKCTKLLKFSFLQSACPEIPALIY